MPKISILRSRFDRGIRTSNTISLTMKCVRRARARKTNVAKKKMRWRRLSVYCKFLATVRSSCAHGVCVCVCANYPEEDEKWCQTKRTHTHTPAHHLVEIARNFVNFPISANVSPFDRHWHGRQFFTQFQFGALNSKYSNRNVTRLKLHFEHRAEIIALAKRHTIARCKVKMKMDKQMNERMKHE